MATAITEDSGDEFQARMAQVFVDSHGLLYEGRTLTEVHKQAFALPGDALAEYGFSNRGEHGLLEVVARVKPTVLIGTTARPGIFNEDVIREMSRHVERPIIFALSNPASKVECAPEEALRWTDGRAVVATGTAFEPVRYGDKLHVIGQANNVFVFPGVGLGCMLSKARVVDDNIFLVAARRLARLVSQDRLAAGAIYPDQSDLRTVSARIAEAVIQEVSRGRTGAAVGDERISALVRGAMWCPEYSMLEG
jgi:malic enzyme